MVQLFLGGRHWAQSISAAVSWFPTKPQGEGFWLAWLSGAGVEFEVADKCIRKNKYNRNAWEVSSARPRKSFGLLQEGIFAGGIQQENAWIGC